MAPFNETVDTTIAPFEPVAGYKVKATVLIQNDFSTINPPIYFMGTYPTFLVYAFAFHDFQRVQACCVPVAKHAHAAVADHP